jgi:outer membrane receptor for ferrienterochelin and colicins
MSNSKVRSNLRIHFRSALSKARWVVIILSFIGVFDDVSSQITVVDARSKEAIPNAQIRYELPDDGNGAAYADNAGKHRGFEYNQTLVVSAVGYTPKKLDYVTGEELLVHLKVMVYDFNEAVVTGQSRVATKEKAVQSITVIDQKEIQSIGALSVRDVILKQSNFTIQQDQVLGTQVSMLGMQGSQVKIMINGVPVIGRLDGNIDLDQLNLGDIERIEIVEGPMSVEYGSDALAGTINLITKQVTKDFLTLHGQYESTRRSSLAGAWGANFGSWNSKISARRIFSDGVANEGGTRSYSWKPKEQLSANLSLERKNEKGSVMIDLEALRENLWSDGEVNYLLEERPINDSISHLINVPYAIDQDFRTLRANARLSAKKKLTSNSDISGFLAANWYNRQRQSKRIDLVNLSETLTPNVADHDTSSFLLLISRATLGIGHKQRFSIGYDVSYEEALGQRFVSEVENYLDAAIFATSDLSVNNWVFHPGVRLAYNSVFKAPLIPSLGIKWAKGKIAFRASYGRGFRAPDLKELYFFFVDTNHNIQGNTNLKAETSDSYQASLNCKQIHSKAISITEVGVFYNHVSDLIDLALSDSDQQLYQYVNIDQQRVVGGKLGEELIQGSWRAKISGTLFWQASEFAETDESAFSPNFQAGLGLDYSMEKLAMTVNTQVNYIGLQKQYYVSNDGLGLWIQDAYSLWSASFGKRLFKDIVDLRLGVNNLLNVTTVGSNSVSSQHQTSTGITPISMGRSLYVSVKLNIK